MPCSSSALVHHPFRLATTAPIDSVAHMAIPYSGEFAATMPTRSPLPMP